MIVMKFGGTSVKDVEAVRRVVQIVGARAAAAPRGGLGPVEGDRRPPRGGAPGRAGRRRRRRARRCSALHRRHEEMAALVRAHRSGAPSSWPRSTRSSSELEAIVRALAVVEEVSPRSADAIVAFGELASSRIVAAALEDAGLASRWVDARPVLVTDAQHGAARPDRAATDERLRSLVRPLARRRARAGGRRLHRRHRGRRHHDARPRRLRLLGRALRRRARGRGDPDLDRRGRHAHRRSAGRRGARGSSRSSASTRRPSSPTSAPRSCTRARSCRRSASASRCASSTRTGPEAAGHADHPRGRAPGDGGPAAIACKRGVTRIDIASTRMLMAYGFLRRVFEVFERFRTPVDVVTTSEVSVSVTIDDRARARRHRGRAVGVRRRLARGRDGDRLRGRRAAAHATRGLATRVLGALEGLPLAMVSQGGSRKNITVVLRDADAPAAMERLHRRFFEGEAAPAERDGARHRLRDDAMRLLVVGHGRMGRLVEQRSPPPTASRWRASSTAPRTTGGAGVTAERCRGVDVAVDFSTAGGDARHRAAPRRAWACRS